MFYDNLVKICAEKNIAPSRLMRELGMSSGLPTQWKKNGRTPHTDTVLTIADYLNVDIHDLLIGCENTVDISDQFQNVMDMQDELFQKRKLLFDLSAKATEEDLDFVTRLVQKLVGDE